LLFTDCERKINKDIAFDQSSCAKRITRSA
jgi:hypothetical protein